MTNNANTTSRIGIVTINYNNARLTQKLLESVSRAVGADDVTVVVVDNASNENDRADLMEVETSFPRAMFIYEDVNHGYFKGINVGLAALRHTAEAPGTVIVCNNDIEFSDDFFITLKASGRLLEDHAVISPRIVTPSGREQNPHVIQPISRARVIVWQIYYSNYTLARIIFWLARHSAPITARRDYRQYKVAQKIEQGYGACYILTSDFFAHYKDLWAPTFLMGEEYFLSCQLKAVGKSVYYEPSLRVVHQDHATMGMLPNKKVWDISRRSFQVYLSYRQKYGRP
ncbi:glycosyltransferase family 2 protein [Novosphingobium jiangmenense]|uniref:Glycosyltransferase n=1 Tax=Novosphingobium jiangmenense TaxID=2791981 RepID=A0ABS0HIR0_9SPHN|nr:glycosyltransferase [Novosphingobium jiangmenense]MBF9152149.1 glycosyltransferase [Novosphingobium jiangmenense]